jgi:hypothetical protein
VVDHLVDLQLAVARPRLEEEVVREVLDEIPRRGDVVAVPGLAVGVLDERAGAARDEVLGLRTSFGSGSAPFSAAPVSIVLIAAETSSIWPNSSAAMFATRS